MHYTTNREIMDVQLQIHQNKQLARFIYTKATEESLGFILLTPGHEYTITITPLGQRSIQSFRDLPNYRRKCKLEDELEENSIFKIYTMDNCMYECEVAKAYDFCQCIPWDFLHALKSNSSECDVFGRTCFYNVIKNVVNFEGKCKLCKM